MIKDFYNTNFFFKFKMDRLVFLTFCNYHTVISNSEKLTHPSVHVCHNICRSLCTTLLTGLLVDCLICRLCTLV